MSSHFKTHIRNHVSKIVSSEQILLMNNANQFQFRTVTVWNPHVVSNTKIIIPPVSICDEIKTIGFGMAVIELLCVSGILIKKVSQKGNKKWFLAPNYKTQEKFFFVDRLSLDRFRHLVKKSSNIPLSFGPAFQQGLIFQQAMD